MVLDSTSLMALSSKNINTNNYALCKIKLCVTIQTYYDSFNHCTLKYNIKLFKSQTENSDIQNVFEIFNTQRFLVIISNNSYLHIIDIKVINSENNKQEMYR